MGLRGDKNDQASDLEQRIRDQSIENNRAEIAPGIQGECDLCGEWSGRLIKGACAPCRDKYKLP